MQPPVRACARAGACGETAPEALTNTKACAHGLSRLRCHLPLICPEPSSDINIGMRVAEETRQWEEGKCLVFDDAYEHEVWYRTKAGRDAAAATAATPAAAANGDGQVVGAAARTGQERVVLLLDVWHPDLTQEEIAAIVDMWGEAKKKGWFS